MGQHILFERPSKPDNNVDEDVSSFSCFASVRDLKAELRKVVWIPPGGVSRAVSLVVTVVLSSSLCVYLADLLGNLLLRGLSALFGLVFV
ncbi:preprotein translocase subunit SecE [Candidatus Similichlamydia epinepheli]|uniref:preprotein translocase subunit SecE n=1 Tax=Candidatus Similichlamydia epinepheli TaxID=1903953 RepID=UPI000D3DA97D|nr:preprotein translocase subunit SecE [Candidatus Similichlamydia epinepheli]